jgi:hypothetical protein
MNPPIETVLVSREPSVVEKRSVKPGGWIAIAVAMIGSIVGYLAMLDKGKEAIAGITWLNDEVRSKYMDIAFIRKARVGRAIAIMDQHPNPCVTNIEPFDAFRSGREEALLVTWHRSAGDQNFQDDEKCESNRRGALTVIDTRSWTLKSVGTLDIGVRAPNVVHEVKGSYLFTLMAGGYRQDLMVHGSVDGKFVEIGEIPDVGLYADAKVIGSDLEIWTRQGLVKVVANKTTFVPIEVSDALSDPKNATVVEFVQNDDNSYARIRANGKILATTVKDAKPETDDSDAQPAVVTSEPIYVHASNGLTPIDIIYVKASCESGRGIAWSKQFVGALVYDQNDPGEHIIDCWLSGDTDPSDGTTMYDIPVILQ